MPSLLSRILRRDRNQPARLIMVDERGHRMEYVHDPDDPIWWRRDGTGALAGWRGVETIAGNFLASRAKERS